MLLHAKQGSVKLLLFYQSKNRYNNLTENGEIIMHIRTATMEDLEAISAIELACFPIKQACTKESFRERLSVYPEHFWILEDEGKIISFVDGFCTDEPVLTDVMYEQASLHRKDGTYQMIFGVNTLPEYRKKGYASKLLRYIIEQAKMQNRKAVILTCKEEKIPFYERLGFENQGKSVSVHGDVTWYQMIRRIDQ